VQTIVLDHFSETGATQQYSPSLPLQSMPDDLNKQQGDEETGEATGAPHNKLGGGASSSTSHAGHDHSAPEIAALANAQAIHSDGCATHHMIQHAHGHRHRKISTYLLEFGVVLHSVIIGIALGVSSGDEFLPLLIALSVHQFFEAFAISTAAMDCGFETLKIPLFLCGLFSVTTPIGQVIGIGLASNYSPNTPGGLLAVGILDGLSAGFLLYDGLVNMLTPTVTHNHQYPKYRSWQKVAIFAALWAGSAAMAVIGYWI
jgi:solute carrier family 39 (zinc transporter), member 1/2/3